MEYIEDRDKIINSLKSNYKVFYNLSTVEKNDPSLLYYAIINVIGNNVETNIKNNILEFVNKFSVNLVNDYNGDFFKDFKDNYRNSIFTLKEEDFLKVIYLFNSFNLSIQPYNINNYVEAYLQVKFNQEYGNAVNIYENILESVRSGHKTEVISYLNKVKELYNYDSLLESIGYTNDTFLSELYMTTTKAKSTLKTICDRTLDKLRSNYLIDNRDKVYNELDFNRFYDKNELVNRVVEQVSYDDLITFIIDNNIVNCDYFKENFIDQDMKLFINNGLKDYLTNTSKKTSKKDTRLFNHLMTYLYDNHYLEKLVDTSDLTCDKKEFPTLSNSEAYDIMIKLDRKIINQDLSALGYFISDTKILGLGNRFNKIFNELNVNYDSKTIASLLSNYNSVCSNKPNNIFEYLNIASNLGTSDIKLRTLFLNDEAYQAYLLNKPPYNNVQLTNEERVDSAYKIAREMYLRNSITVPSIDKYYFANGHKYHVTIGNFNDFSQLALGELTSSCERNGSFYADDLYKYCLLNKNGFNVVIRENNKIVAKASGFRNGNTIILNQLRDNFYPDNKSLVTVMRKLSLDLVNLSNKHDPIKNVIIGNESCMKDEPTKDLSKYLSKLFTNMSKLYCDIDYQKVCLLTSDFYPFNFHNTKDTYPVLRDCVNLETNKDNMNLIINHYHLLDSLVKKVNINNISIIDYDVTNINELYYGHDYYLIIYNDKTYKSFILNNSIQATDEIEIILNNIKEKVIKK